MNAPHCHRFWCASAAVFAAAVCTGGVFAQGAPSTGGPNTGSPSTPWQWAPDVLGGYASDHIMIKLAPGARITVDHTGAVIALSSRGKYDHGVAAVLADAHPTSAARAWAMPPQDAVRAGALGIDRWIRVGVPVGTDTPALVARLQLAGLNGATIRVAEIDAIGGTADSEAPTPNDPEFVNQWGMENTGQSVVGVSGTPGADIRARAAWHVTTGSHSTVIAVLDSGVNLHQDFANRMVAGWNVPQLSTSTADLCANHGTHVTGVLAAEGDNTLDIAGIAWNAQIMPVVVVNPCSGMSSWLADGLYWAVDHGATIANMSLQYNVGTQYLYDAVLYTQAAHVPMIAAAGNNGFAGVSWPAKWPEVIAVGSLQSDDAAASTTAVGPEVDVAAPGVQVLSTINTTGADYKNGTSMACPHVAGTVALMQAVAPGLSIANLRTALEGTCTDVQDPGFDQTSGYGRINAGAAVRSARTIAGLGDLNSDGIVDGADLGLLLGAWGQPCGTPCSADLNDDNVVDGADLGLLLGGWTFGD